eukprot:188764-Rhodomonas_salina.1
MLGSVWKKWMFVHETSLACKRTETIILRRWTSRCRRSAFGQWLHLVANVRREQNALPKHSIRQNSRTKQKAVRSWSETLQQSKSAHRNFENANRQRISEVQYNFLTVWLQHVKTRREMAKVARRMMRR